MKKCLLCISAFLAFIFVIALCADIAQAQPIPPDLSIWIGKWVKMSIKATKGVLYEGSGSANPSIGKVSGGSTYYACISPYNDDTIYMTIYESVDRSAIEVGAGTVTWDVGSNTDWVGSLSGDINAIPTDPNLNFFGPLLLKGTFQSGSTTVLSKGTIRSIGTYGNGYYPSYNLNFGWFGVTLKGSLVAKLPFSPVPVCP